MIFLFVFFFKQKTAYEVRISDWSSDVCSSDLLLMHPRCASVDYSRLKYILYGAAPIPLDLLRQCMRMFGAQFIQAYGMTETTGTISMLPPGDHDPRGNKRMRSAGKPLPGVEIRILGPDEQEMPMGEVGEVIRRSSNTKIGKAERRERGGKNR